MIARLSLSLAIPPGYATAVWPAADWHERETWELVGSQWLRRAAEGIADAQFMYGRMLA